MKNFITSVLIFATSFLNGMSESLQREIADAEDSLERALMSDFTRETLEGVKGKLEGALKKWKDCYPEGIRSVRDEDGVVCMMRLEEKINFLKDCMDFLLGGEETDKVKRWRNNCYGCVHLEYAKASN